MTDDAWQVALRVVKITREWWFEVQITGSVDVVMSDHRSVEVEDHRIGAPQAHRSNGHELLKLLSLCVFVSSSQLHNFKLAAKYAGTGRLIPDVVWQCC